MLRPVVLAAGKHRPLAANETLQDYNFVEQLLENFIHTTTPVQLDYLPDLTHSFVIHLNGRVLVNNYHFTVADKVVTFAGLLRYEGLLYVSYYTKDFV